MIERIKVSVICSFLLFLSFNLNAIELKVEFSADAVQISPGRAPLVSKMFVSKNAVRTEMFQQGNRIVEISDLNKGKRLILYPESKMYLEQKTVAMPTSKKSKKFKTPCDGVTDVKCKKLASETLNKIKVVKWQVEKSSNGKTYKSLHWIDSKRYISIKDMFHDGGMAELIMKGKGKLDDRDVELWESRYTHPSGQNRISRQWYDPQLKMVIKEELPGGFLREIKNIKVAKQDKSLFKLPKGYVKAKGNKVVGSKEGNLQSQGRQY